MISYRLTAERKLQRIEPSELPFAVEVGEGPAIDILLRAKAPEEKRPAGAFFSRDWRIRTGSPRRS
jgi:hypothetical protein